MTTDELARRERVEAKVKVFMAGVDAVCNTGSREPAQAAALACTDAGGLHRGLQQELMGLVLAWLGAMADKASEGRHDGRNKRACETARLIRERCPELFPAR